MYLIFNFLKTIYKDYDLNMQNWLAQGQHVHCPNQ